MTKVEEIMHTAGWFDASPDGPANVGDLTPIVPTQILSGSEWKAAVQNKDKKYQMKDKKIFLFKEKT